MKNFEEFISLITPEEYESMRADIMENRTPCSSSYALPEISFIMSMKLLEKYHDWLQN